MEAATAGGDSWLRPRRVDPGTPQGRLVRCAIFIDKGQGPAPNAGQFARDMDKKLLDIICCPITKLPLQVLDGDRLARLNAGIGAGAVVNSASDMIRNPLSEALVTRDGRLVYPVRDGVPVLLEEESIDWKQLPD